MSDTLFGNYNKKRTLGIRDKEILYQNAGGKCENCGRVISYIEMEVGHKTAWARGGATTMKNSVCLCPICNKLQGTDKWETFQKKQGKALPTDTRMAELIPLLQRLKIKQLKELCAELGIARPKPTQGSVGFFDDPRAPSPSAYINKIIKSKVDTEKIKSYVSKYIG